MKVRRNRSAGGTTVKSMRHIISVTLQNEVGALNRVAGLFATRGYNIESLSVAPTDDPSVSRLTVVTTGSDAIIQQISNQLLKLVDVVDVEDVTREEHFERELLLIKVKGKPTLVGLPVVRDPAGGRTRPLGRGRQLHHRAHEQRGGDQSLHRRGLELRRGARGRALRRAGDPEGQGDPGVLTSDP